MKAVSCRRARDIDVEAIAACGIPEAELVRKAGAACADALARFTQRPVAVLAGPGNNAADALRAADRLVSAGIWLLSDLTVVLRSEKERAALASGRETPFAEHLRALAEAGARILSWDGPGGTAARSLREARLVLDGLSGTGLSGPATGAVSEMIETLNGMAGDGSGRLVVSVDIPSGLSDTARPGDPMLRADVTLAVEPLKACLYRPFARAKAGRIVHIRGIFPSGLVSGGEGIEVTDFSAAAKLIPPVPGDAYKHRRGLVEIHAGSAGTTGAAKLAARGAAAAGAGLIRLIADQDTWPILAASETGTMVKPPSRAEADLPPADAYLIGPGWGTGDGRAAELRRLFTLPGTASANAAFVLDADALRILARDNMKLPPATLLTPHPGEFACLVSCGKDQLEADPDPLLLGAAARFGATIVLKGHVMRIAAPDGRLAYVDGMEPVLSVGGSGDGLAGLAAGLAARERRRTAEGGLPFDPYPSAVAAAALLVEAGRAARRERGFCDAAEFAAAAGRLAGGVWLPESP